MKIWKRPSVSFWLVVLFRVGPEPEASFRHVQCLEAVTLWSPWIFRTADSCSQQTLMIALVMLFVKCFMVINTFLINYQLPCSTITLPILQMGGLRQRLSQLQSWQQTIVAWWPEHEISWCFQSPQNFGHLISQNSFAVVDGYLK